MNQEAGLHVGIILDGNRRWAQRHNLPILEGHRAGARNVQQLLEWAREYNIRELTLYTFSMQNFRRPIREVRDLFVLLREYFTELLNDYRLHRYQIQVRIAGQIERFPRPLQNILKKLVFTTQNYQQYRLNFALGYGGREELVAATKAIAVDVEKGVLKPKDITERAVNRYLSVRGELDIVIRTGGERRMSNFLPWQTIYSEWFFVKKPWPAFARADLKRIVEAYHKRERRFGE